MQKRTRDTYIVSDLHFFHSNIIKYCGRPYKVEGPNSNPANKAEVERMSEDLLKMFDKLPDSCDVWNLGDVFFLGTTQQTKFLDNPENIDRLKVMVARMKGKDRKLFLVLGNHDNLHLPHQSRIKFYYSLGFDKVYDTPVILEDKYILSHEPVYLTPGSNFTNLYGHTHDLSIKEDYFTYDYDNYAMITRCYKQNGEEPPKIEQKWPDRLINLGQYRNMCLDNSKSILHWVDGVFEKKIKCWE